jgi:hypothetical protein
MTSRRQADHRRQVGHIHITCSLSWWCSSSSTKKAPSAVASRLASNMCSWCSSSSSSRRQTGQQTCRQRCRAQTSRPSSAGGSCTYHMLSQLVVMQQQQHDKSQTSRPSCRVGWQTPCAEVQQQQQADGSQTCRQPCRAQTSRPSSAGGSCRLGSNACSWCSSSSSMDRLVPCAVHCMVHKLLLRATCFLTHSRSALRCSFAAAACYNACYDTV